MKLYVIYPIKLFWPPSSTQAETTKTDFLEFYMTIWCWNNKASSRVSGYLSTKINTYVELPDWKLIKFSAKTQFSEEKGTRAIAQHRLWQETCTLIAGGWQHSYSTRVVPFLILVFQGGQTAAIGHPNWGNKRKWAATISNIYRGWSRQNSEMKDNA